MNLIYAGLFALVSAGTECTPVTVVANAVIHTVDQARPRASALAYDGCGRILAVGDDDAVLAGRDDAMRIDAGGRTIVPGLIDAHAHLMGLGFQLLRADLTGAGTKAEALERLRRFEATLPAEGWLLGRGWDQNDWPEKTYPTRADLDAEFPERPVWLRRIDGHAGWANSAALAAADRDFGGDWQPEGGRILRDAENRATGVLIDRAMDLVEAAVPAPTSAEREAALTQALAYAARVGLTGVHDAGVSVADFELYRRFATGDELTLRVYAMTDGTQALFETLCRDGPFIDAWLTARSVKLYADGALGSRGAALKADYSDDPGNAGLLIQPVDELAAQVDRAMRCGLQVNTHAIGDRGNQVVLDAYAAAAGKYPSNPGRHRIEHAQVIALEDLKRFADQRVIASVQPTHATSDMYWAEDRVGPERIRGGYAWQRLRELGVPLALGSDFPVEKPDPLLGLYAAVARQDEQGWPEGGWHPDQRLTREQALYGFTLGAAYAAFQEDQLGSLEPGKRADFVVLGADPMTVAAEQIPRIDVIATVVGGRTVYRHPDGGWAAPR